MKFSGGQQCWNGPARSAIIILHCAATNSLKQVTEPNRYDKGEYYTSKALKFNCCDCSFYIR